LNGADGPLADNAGTAISDPVVTFRGHGNERPFRAIPDIPINLPELKATDVPAQPGQTGSSPERQSLHSNACLHGHQRIAGAAIRQQVDPHIVKTSAFGIELHKGSMAIGIERPPDRDGLHREAAV